MGIEENTFDILILIARPAAGKSEIIDFLKKMDEGERRSGFHVSRFEEIDDFPMLWTWFEEDSILEEMGISRIHTTGDGYFKERYLWDLLIRRVCLEYRKKVRGFPAYHAEFTTLLEFSRGTEHGGFQQAFQQIDPDILSASAVLYLDVSWEESLRKNRKRFNPDRPDSILEHGLPEDKMEKLYRHSDWEQISSGDPEYLDFSKVKIPYAVFPNEDDVTSTVGTALRDRLKETLALLWGRYCRRQ